MDTKMMDTKMDTPPPTQSLGGTPSSFIYTTLTQNREKWFVTPIFSNNPYIPP